MITHKTEYSVVSAGIGVSGDPGGTHQFSAATTLRQQNHHHHHHHLHGHHIHHQHKHRQKAPNFGTTSKGAGEG